MFMSGAREGGKLVQVLSLHFFIRPKTRNLYKLAVCTNLQIAVCILGEDVPQVKNI